MFRVNPTSLVLAFPSNLKFFIPDRYCYKTITSLCHACQQRPASRICVVKFVEGRAVSGTNVVAMFDERIFGSGEFVKRVTQETRG